METSRRHRRGAGENHESMRRRNLGAVLRLVHEESEISRAAVTTRMQLARGTVGGLLDELERLGLLGLEEATGPRAAGRPSLIAKARLGSARIFAADIGTDHISAGYLGLGATLFAHSRRRTPPRQDPETVADVVADMFRDFADLKTPTTALLGVGIGIPGMVSEDQVVRSAPNLGWQEVPFAALIRKRLPGPHPTLTANDADLGALAEHRRGAAKGSTDVVYIGCDDFGVGGGLIFNGAQYFGSAGYAGELGHLPINPAGRTCHCGSRGCWETEIGTARVAEVLGTSTDIASVATALHNVSIPSPELNEVGAYLGRGIAAIINLLNVNHIVLGGTLAHLYPTVRLATDTAIELTALRALRSTVTVELSQLGDHAPLLGAAEMIVDSLVADPVAYVEEIQPLGPDLGVADT